MPIRPIPISCDPSHTRDCEKMGRRQPQDDGRDNGNVEGFVAPLEEVCEEIDAENPVHETDVVGMPEARCPPTLAEPHLPTPKEREVHCRTHVPYRSWCSICVEAEAREDAHRADAADRDGEQRMPTMAFDYDFYGEGLKRKDRGDVPLATEVTAMVMKDCKTGSLWAHTAACKGPKDQWLMRRLVANVESAGHSAIRLKSDGEPAAKAVQADLIARRPPPRRTVPVNPPEYDPLANGAIENAVQRVNVQLRKIKRQLETRTKLDLAAKHPIVEWALEHAAFQLTRLVVGTDGKTAYERATSRQWRGQMLEFGEQVMAKLTKPKQFGLGIKREAPRHY